MPASGPRPADVRPADGPTRACPAGPVCLGGASQGQHDEDDSNDRLTWLTEDDMVWQGDGTGAPPVLGSTED